MIALWDSFEFTKTLPTAVKTVSASAAAAGFRVFLMPIDACKTIMQVEGADGLQKLGAKIKKGGPLVLYHGSLGAMSATFVGHYPWFYTYNYLNTALPVYDRKKELPKYLGRNALIGFCSSAVSDTCSNSIRVIKTTTQTSTVPIGYVQAVKMVIEKDGISGLMFRGLVTKIISNGCQGILFSVLWRMGQDYLNSRK
uniref:ADP,ATP carrier protein n=1 Tax=Haptolina ericina TaxID=156174 RepID=A0A7S3BBF0_9EUKA